jgi:hypothetical protein
VLYFEDDYLEVELAIHIYVDKWPMTDLRSGGGTGSVHWSNRGRKLKKYLELAKLCLVIIKSTIETLSLREC